MTERRACGEYVVVAIRWRERREEPAVGSVSAGMGQLTLESIYREHAAFVWRSANYLCRAHVCVGEVDDVVHDVFLILHRRLHEYRPGRSLQSWLFGITRHVVLRYARGVNRAKRRLECVPSSGTPVAVDEELERQRILRVVESGLARLRVDQRLVLSLMLIEGMTAPETADALGIKLNTVYSRLRLGRRKLARALAVAGGEELADD